VLKTYIAVKTRILDLKDRFTNDVSGASLVEYSVLVGLITIGTVALITTVGESVTTIWTNLDTNMATAAAAGG
jgi:pilus assembly protein Flp/PilA